MPPGLNLLTTRTAVPVLRQSTTAFAAQRYAALSRPCNRSSVQLSFGEQRRWNSDKKNLEEAQRKAESMPHVSEEAAEVDKIMNKEKWCDGTPSSPELEQGTPVSEILSRDKEAQKHAPKVFQDQMKKPSGSRSFSTSTGRSQLEERKGAATNSTPPSMSEADQTALLESMITQVTEETQALMPGLKFPAPESIPRTENFRSRYEPVVEQFTKNLMRDGKLATAQKNMNIILDILRSSPPPQINPRRPLLPGPAPAQLPLNPIAYLTLIVDSVAPLVKLHHAKGIAGGGNTMQIPLALAEKQRRRAAIGWIIDASNKRRDAKLAHRVANELIAVAEGRSGVWEKRDGVHKLGIAARVNIGAKPKKINKNGWV
ncbi:ribosomal protein S7 domain-containing protein [Aspergillus tetrazonus]